MLSSLWWPYQPVGSHSNLAAIASISHGGANGLDTASKWWIIVHNVGMAATFVVNFGCTLVRTVRLLFSRLLTVPTKPLAIKTNIIANKLFADIFKLIVIFDTAAKQLESTGSASEFDGPIAILSAGIDADTKFTRDMVIAILCIGSFFSVMFGVAAIASFSFVRKLRKQSRWNRTRQILTQNSVMVTTEQRTIVEQPENGEDTIAMSPVRGIPSTRIADGKDNVTFGTTPVHTLPFAQSTDQTALSQATQAKLKSAKEQTADEAALTRLAYDLSLSLPCILFMVSDYRRMS